jgi:chitinase
MEDNTKATHHTALYYNEKTVIKGCSIKETVKDFIEKGASIEKLIIGIAFYGRKFIMKNEEEDFGKSYKKEAIRYSKIRSELILKGVKENFDEIAKAPYIILKDENKSMIFYDNERSIEEKMKYLKEEELGGLMFWEYGSDSTYTLIKTIRENK